MNSGTLQETNRSSGIFLRDPRMTLSQNAPRNIMDVLHAQNEYRIFTGALEGLHLGEQLRNSGPYTVFAPTDEAFAQVPQLAKLLSNPERLRETLNRHIVWGYLDMQSLSGIKKLSPIVGESIRIRRCKLRVADAEIVHANIHAPNGMIHGISRLFTDNNYSFFSEVCATIDTAIWTVISTAHVASQRAPSSIRRWWTHHSESQFPHEKNSNEPGKTQSLRTIRP